MRGRERREKGPKSAASQQRASDPRPVDADQNDEALEAFLEEASRELPDGEAGLAHRRAAPGAPAHRRLQVLVSEDRLEARLEAVFADTSREEIDDALHQGGVVWGLEEDELGRALARADRSGRAQRNVLAARGRPAVYKQRREVRYPFLEGLTDPRTGDSLHLASWPLREISGVMEAGDLAEVQEYAIPVVAVVAGSVLMEVEGEDVVEAGVDVFGKEIRGVPGDERSAARPGEGVGEDDAGSLRATGFGYVSVGERRLSVVSPIWISPNRMEAYFVNPPHLGERKYPTDEEIGRLLQEKGVCFGIDQDAIAELVRDLQRAKLRESCVRVARGQPPDLRGHAGLTFEPLPEALFQAVVDAFRAPGLDEGAAAPPGVRAVQEGQVLCEQSDTGERPTPGKDLFGQTVAPPEEALKRKPIKAGVNVRQEVGEGWVRLVSEIYGYPGLLDGELRVVSPIWLATDRMAAYFVALGEEGKRVLPRPSELETLLERAQTRHGVDDEAVVRLCQKLPSGEGQGGNVTQLARGTPPTPGQDGTVELLFQQLPDPGTILEGGSMDFRERNAVPQVQRGQLLARRSFPTPGEAGVDVRGHEVPPPKIDRALLFSGPNVVHKDESGEKGTVRLYYATSTGWARVVKDTLAVWQRYQHSGDVDYRVGNITMEGDVEITGSLKSRFTVQATGMCSSAEPSNGTLRLPPAVMSW